MKIKDFILIGAILVITVATILVSTLTKKEGAYVLVKVGTDEIARYYLSEDGEYELNGGTNILRIEEGAAYLIDATCPDHLCVKQGKIDQTNEAIVCKPNKLTIIVCNDDPDAVANENNDDVDLIS